MTITNQNNRLNDKLNTVFVLFLFLLLICNTLMRSQFETAVYIGEISVELTFYMMLLILILSWFQRPTYDVSFITFYMTIFLIGCLFIISYTVSPYMIDFISLLHLLFLLLFIISSARMKWTRITLKIAGYLFGIVTILIFYDWIQSGFPTSSFKSIYRNENYLAILLYSFVYFQIICLRLSQRVERLFFLFITVINFILIIATSARSILISFFLLIIFWIILKLKRQFFSRLIYIVLAGNFLFISIYVSLSYMRLGDILNDLSRSIFNKNLFSGRTEIWIEVIKKVIEKPFFGYGIGVKASHITDINLTTHNMYLQFLMEFGIIGIVLFSLLFISIWRLLMRRLDHFVVRWTSCFMLSILVYLSFEVTLFQNNYSIAFFQWIIMTIGINFKDDS